MVQELQLRPWLSLRLQPAPDARQLRGQSHSQVDDAKACLVTSGEGVPTSALWWQGGLRVRKDHRYRWSAAYENPTRVAAPDGGMGVVAGVVFASEAEWPPLDRKDADYVADLMGTIEAPHKQEHHQGHAMGH